MRLAWRGAVPLTAVGLMAGLTACGGGRPADAGRVPAAPRPPGQAGPGGAAGGAAHSLVLMLDGVPWTVMDSLARAGHFRGFAPPSRLFSTFPSLTTLAFREIWREAPTRGYEERYFDLEANRLEGGAWDVLSGKEASEGFHRHVDVEGKPVVSGLAYAFPERIAPVELSELRSGIFEKMQRDSVVVAYSISTDAVAHAAGRAGQVKVVLQYEALVDEVRRRYPGVRVDLLSDHGNDFVPSRRIALDDELRRAGFHPGKHLEHPGDVVIPEYGLVGCVAVYAAAPDRARLSAALARATGVELAVRDSAGTVLVEGATGRARIDADARGTRFRYLPETGDPLGLAPAVARLRASGELDASGFAPDSSWLRESVPNRYPDALRRLVAGTRGAVLNPAAVVLSLAPGHHFGDPIGNALTSMEGTHGSLRGEGSTGFFMSTEGPRPPIVRGDQVLDWLPAALQGPAPAHVSLRAGGARPGRP